MASPARHVHNAQQEDMLRRGGRCKASNGGIAGAVNNTRFIPSSSSSTLAADPGPEPTRHATQTKLQHDHPALRAVGTNPKKRHRKALSHPFRFRQLSQTGPHSYGLRLVLPTARP
ncbi:hypothetical protein VTH06DRAFT_3362 [Thermothelomyces fergusii]